MSDRIDLRRLGWNAHFEAHFAPHREAALVPARVAREDRERYVVRGEFGEWTATLPGRARLDGPEAGDWPAVGDWVAIEPVGGEAKGIIRATLPRRTRIARQAAGAVTREQVLAANVDVAFLVSSLDGGRNFHPATVARYLLVAYESGASPVVLLNKCDLAKDLDACVAEAESIAPGVPVLALSAFDGRGIDELRALIRPGETAAFLGRSGVGKSTLINRLLGEDALAAGEVREDDRRGRHTTTWRELIVLPEGGIVVDTPGMRELQFWSGEEAIAAEFADIEGLSSACRFRDCGHISEPGCAVKAAVDAGVLDAGRLEEYQTFLRELAHQARRQDNKARMAEKAAGRQMSSKRKEVKAHNPKRRDERPGG